MNCPKHLEFYSKNKFEKLVHLVGFIIRIYHDAQSSERLTLLLLITFHKRAFKKRLISRVGKHIKSQTRSVGTTKKSVFYYRQDKISTPPQRQERLWRLHRFLSNRTGILSLGHEAEQSTEVSNKWSYTSAVLLLRGVALN